MIIGFSNNKVSKISRIIQVICLQKIPTNARDPLYRMFSKFWYERYLEKKENKIFQERTINNIEGLPYAQK